MVQRSQEGTAESFLDDVEQFIHRGQATGVILDSAKDQVAAQTMLDYWLATLIRAGRETPADTMLAEYDQDSAPQLDDAAYPYQGLEAFGETGGGDYFGRQALVDEIIGRLREHRIAIIVGPCGCGRSSLVSAGVIPALKSGALPGSESWRFLPAIEPGAMPLLQLARPLLPVGTLADAIQREARRFLDDPGRLRRLLDDAGGNPALVVIDSFEKLIGHCSDKAACSAFVENLVDIVTAAGSPHAVVLIVLSDYESLLSEFPCLEPFIERSEVRVRPAGPKELRLAIERPAEQAGLKFEDGVVDSLVHDVLGEPAALLLLQFNLLKLWDKRDRNRITQEAYREVGGGRVALIRAAEAFYAALTPDEQETAKRIFLRLVRLGDLSEALPARARRDGLCLIGTGSSSKGEAVLDALMRARLVRVIPGDEPDATEVELVHPSLVGNWQRLIQWIEDRRAWMTRRRRLEATAAEWVRLGRGEGGLLDEIALAEVERWLNNTEVTALGANVLGLMASSLEFIKRRKKEAEAARQRETDIREAQAVAAVEARRARMFRRMLIAVAIVAGVAVGSALWALAAESRARMNELLAESAENLAKHPQLSIKLAGEAWSIGGERPETIRALYRAGLNSRARWTLAHELASTPSGPGLNAVAVSSDGARLATAGQAAVKLWDAASGAQIASLPHPAAVNGVSFSPDGKLLATSEDATVGESASARIWDVSGKMLLRLPHDKAVKGVAFSPDGSLVATASEDGKARLWNVSSGVLVRAMEHQAALSTVAFDGNGTILATAGADGLIRLWDLVRGDSGSVRFKKLGEVHLGGVHSVAFSPDGRFLAAGCEDNAARVFNADSGKELLVLPVFTNEVKSVAFATFEGRLLLAGGIADRRAKVWEIKVVADGVLEGEELYALHEHEGWVTGVAFSPDGRRLFTASADGKAMAWDAIPEHEWAELVLPPPRPPVPLLRMALSADGHYLAVVRSRNSSAAVWDLTRPIRPESPWFRADHGTCVDGKDAQCVTAVAFSPDGRLATGDNSGQVKVWSVAERNHALTLSGLLGPVAAITFNRDGKSMAAITTSSSDGKASAVIWNEKGLEQGRFAQQASGIVGDATLSPDGTFLAIADGPTVRLWDVAAKTLRPDLRGPKRNVPAIAFSPDGQLLAGVSRDMTGTVWDPASGKVKAELKGNEAGLRVVAFSRNGRFLATGGDDVIKVWDVPSFKEMFTLPSPSRNSRIEGIAFDQHGNLVAAATDGTVRRYNLRLVANQHSGLQSQGANASISKPGDSVR